MKTALETYNEVLPDDYRTNNELTYAVERIYKELSFPTKLFKNIRLLDIGGGTGKRSQFYAKWGAQVTILEPNKKSCEKAKKYPLAVINAPLSDDTNFDYDMVVCMGVLHHTDEPFYNLNLILSKIPSKTFVVIGMMEHHGFFKRTLQRKFIYKQSHKEDEIIKLAKKYFKSHIKRAVKYGLRSELSVIYDCYVNAQTNPLKLHDICNAFLKNNVKYHSAYPTLKRSNDTIPINQRKKDHFDYKFYEKDYKKIEKIWMTAGGKSSAKELYELEKKIDKGNIKNLDISPIQEGYMGVGLNYFVGMKA